MPIHYVFFFVYFYQLAVECGVGIAVFVRCFVDKKGMNQLIAEKLGVGFSQIPFAIVVVGCCLLQCFVTLICVFVVPLFFI